MEQADLYLNLCNLAQPVPPEEARALTGVGLTFVREPIRSSDFKAKRRRTIILPDDLRGWLKTLPNARKQIEESPA